MLGICEITIDEFKSSIYAEYEKLFPKDEQRDFIKIENTYNKGIEKIYKITLDNKIIGFFMIEKLDTSHPYYLDYFAIFTEFQNKGYGTDAMKLLINEVATNDGLIGEIEKVSKDNLLSVRRLEFYKKAGFKEMDSEYVLYNVHYTPIINLPTQNVNKTKLDSIFFDYYTVNAGKEATLKNCKIIK